MPSITKIKRKKRLGIGFLTAVILVSAGAFSAWAQTQPTEMSDPRLNEAAVLKSRGELQATLTIYEDLLSDGALSSEEFDRVRRDYQQIRFQLITSRDLTPASQYHTVVPGDSLYKIAKKYATTVDLIKKSNGLTHDTIYPDMKLKVVTGRFSVLVDKSENKLMLYLDEKPLKTYRVATGEDNGTPTGTFKIINKLVDPTWYRSGAVLPPDSPENALGTRWLGLDHPGYGIHGTIEPETIGRQITAGCVRMLNEDVEELYSIVPTGTQVTVVD